MRGRLSASRRSSSSRTSRRMSRPSREFPVHQCRELRGAQYRRMRVVPCLSLDRGPLVVVGLPDGDAAASAHLGRERREQGRTHELRGGAVSAAPQHASAVIRVSSSLLRESGGPRGTTPKGPHTTAAPGPPRLNVSLMNVTVHPRLAFPGFRECQDLPCAQGIPYCGQPPRGGNGNCLRQDQEGAHVRTCAPPSEREGGVTAGWNPCSGVTVSAPPPSCYILLRSRRSCF